MFITKKHLSRRTFLQAAGATMALPFLDSMIPAMTAQTKTAAAAAFPAGLRLSAARRDHGSLDAEDRRDRLRIHADPPTAGEAPRSPERHQRTRPPGSGYAAPCIR